MSCVNEEFTFDEWNVLLDGIEQLIEHKFHSVRTSGEEMDYWMNVCCKLKSISPQDPRQVTLERVKNGIKSNIL